jgi:hypothetical protein
MYNGLHKNNPEALSGIDKAIAENGSLQSITVQNNRESANSSTVNLINPSENGAARTFSLLPNSVMSADATRVAAPAIIQPISPQKENN